MERSPREIAIIAAGCAASLCIGMISAFSLKPSYAAESEHWGPRLELTSAPPAREYKFSARKIGKRIHFLVGPLLQPALTLCWRTI